MDVGHTLERGVDMDTRLVSRAFAFKQCFILNTLQ
jgi:hypothetical protein